MRWHGLVVGGLVLIAAPLRAQDSMITEVHNLAGPRVGFGMSVSGAANDRLSSHDISSPYSQFGWTLEQLAFGGRPDRINFVVQETVVVGALDQGKFLPAGWATMGLRTPDGWEAGLGPELAVHGFAVSGSVGRSIHYGNVTIPITFMISSLTREPHVNFLLGFAVESIRR